MSAPIEDLDSRTGAAMSRRQLDELPDPCFATDAASGRIVAWNPAAARLTGWPERAALGLHCAGLIEGVDHGAAPVCAASCPHLAQYRGGDASIPTTEGGGERAPNFYLQELAPHPDMLIRVSDGSRRSVVVIGMPAVLHGRQVLVHMLRSVDELEHDSLTGALTHDGFLARLIDEQRRADHEHAPLAVALVDLDDLEQRNDTEGHAAGDHALQIVARVLGHGRPTDSLGRWGSDEFSLLMPVTTVEAAAVRLWRSLAAVRAASSNEEIVVTFSAGITEALRGETWERVIDRAAAALDEAKHGGKAQVQVVPPDAPVSWR
jgi:diguanylate cyclase (GGDEF)-like protein